MCLAPMDSHSKASFSIEFAQRLPLCGLFAFAATLPHSIALAQLSAGVMLLGWIGMRGWSREKFRWRTPWTWPLLAFVAWSVLSAIVSYEPRISIDKLRSVSLFLIFFLVFNLVDGSRLVRMVMLTLACSCLINIGYVYVMKIRGRGMEIVRLAPQSPLAMAGLQAGDVILRAGGRGVSDQWELAQAARRQPIQALELFVFRPEIYFYLTVPRPPGGWPRENGWGLESKRWHSFRASGFYDWNYFTYAEVLQLIASLMVALAWTAAGWQRVCWSLAGAATTGAIALTLTRAVWAAFAVSVGVMIFRSGKKAFLISAIALGLLLAPIALNAMREGRRISLLQRNEPSASYRLTIWHEGWRLLWSKPRHVLVGVGMDSIKRHWHEWGLFAGGRLPVGHMHSTPLQLGLERGVPALLLWIWWFGVYVTRLWKRTGAGNQVRPMGDRALSLGALGGTVGFLLSSLVHYNFGDSEAIMTVYLIMGLVAADEARRGRESEKTLSSFPHSGTSPEVLSV